MEFHHVTGSQETKPLEVDDQSSKSVVYVRKNIKEIEKEEDGRIYRLWEYDEAILSPGEYAAYKEIKDIIDAEKGDDDTQKILDALLGGAA